MYAGCTGLCSWAESPTTNISIPGFVDPLNTPLPHAPSLKIACLYGIGSLTQRAYHMQTYETVIGPAFALMTKAAVHAQFAECKIGPILNNIACFVYGACIACVTGYYTRKCLQSVACLDQIGQALQSRTVSH